MKLTAVVAIVAALPAVAWAISPLRTPVIEKEPVISKDENHFSQQFVRGKNVIRVELGRRPFIRAKHHVRVESGAVIEVDGRQALGTDAGPPEHLLTEIAYLRVSWNGKRTEVDPAFFRDCFNPAVGSTRILPSEDFRTVLVTLGGGDGAGAYGVFWTISADGLVSRFLNDGQSL